MEPTKRNFTSEYAAKRERDAQTNPTHWTIRPHGPSSYELVRIVPLNKPVIL